MRKLLLFSIALLFIRMPMRGELINDTVPPTSQFGDTLLQNASNNDALRSPQVVLPSPQSQLFEKYVNHKITEYNGLPDITIPLYEIEIKGLKIPIALTYHASGIKYKQFDGEVGAGWSINAGGYRVTRTMYGRADDLCDFYSETDYHTYVELPNDQKVRNGYLGRIAIDDEGNGNDLRSTIIYRGGFDWTGASPEPILLDSEYDQFTYMLPSSNGHFIITNRNTRTTAIAEPNRDSIQLGNFNHLINNAKLNDIQIMDESGFLYLLGGTNYVEGANWNVPHFLNNYNTAWLLKTIVSPYNDNIEFKYTPASYINSLGFDEHDFQIISDAPSLDHDETIYFNQFSDDYIRKMVTVTHLFQNPHYISQQFIKEIQTDKEKITFTRETGIGKYLLKNIKIEDRAGNILKEIELQYNKVGYHNLLEAVLLKKGTSVEKRYNFQYCAGEGNAMDQWGYYASAPAKQYNINDLFLHNEFLTDQIKVGVQYEPSSLAVGQNPSIWIDRKNLSGRVPNDYALNKITFPTGGTTEYTYESNQYQYDDDTFHGGGLRIRKIVSDPGGGQPKVITQYKYGHNEDGNGVINFDRNIDEECFVKETFYLSHAMIQLGKPSILAFAQFATKTYSTHPLIPEYADFSVFYDQITTYRCEENGTNTTGKIISEYETPVQYTIGGYQYGQEGPVLSYQKMPRIDHRVNSYHLGVSPLLTSRKFLKNNNDTVKTEIYSYGNPICRIYVGKKVDQSITAEQYRQTNSCLAGDKDIYCSREWLFCWLDYDITLATKLLNTKIERLFTNQGIVTTTENYEYNDKNQLCRTAVKNSNQINFINEYKYPWNYADSTYSEMTSNNRLSPVIETITKQGNTETARIKTNYFKDAIKTNGLILPQSVQSSYQGSSNPAIEYTCDLYDNKGNIRQITGKDGVPTTYLWGYNQKYPIAEIKNATYTQIRTSLGGNDVLINRVSNAYIPTETDLTTVNSLLRALPNAQVTTYTYKPLVGILTATDPRGVTVYYNYDAFGRLQSIVDKNNKVIENYNYHYKNQ